MTSNTLYRQGKIGLSQTFNQKLFYCVYRSIKLAMIEFNTKTKGEFEEIRPIERTSHIKVSSYAIPLPQGGRLLRQIWRLNKDHFIAACSATVASTTGAFT